MNLNRTIARKRSKIIKQILSVVLLTLGLYILGIWEVGSHGHIRFRPWMREDWVMLSLILITIGIPTFWLIRWFLTFDSRKEEPIPAKQTYKDRISNLVLWFNKDIAAVKDLQMIKSLNYTKDNLAEVRLLIYSKDFKEIDSLKEVGERYLYDLTIFTFHDEKTLSIMH